MIEWSSRGSENPVLGQADDGTVETSEASEPSNERTSGAVTHSRAGGTYEP